MIAAHGTTSSGPLNGTNAAASIDLCVGCGVCAGVCPTGNLVMAWTDTGLLRPQDRGTCVVPCGRCLAVCPSRTRVEDETTLACACFSTNTAVRFNRVAGYFLNVYAGSASPGYRARGASGGMASWFLASLLEQDKVDCVVHVRADDTPGRLFDYSLTTQPEEVRRGAKSVYYPVELSRAIQAIVRHPKRYAIVGLPCVLKALRLAMLMDSLLRGRIVMLVGLVCGQNKSRAFVDYLALSNGIDPASVTSVSFREKPPNKAANQFQALIRTAVEAVAMPREGLYGKTWASGEFTPACCQICDDVFAETADVVFMDAWLLEYVRDGGGTSLVLTRSEEAQRHIEQGIKNGEAAIRPIDIEDLIRSQAGVVERKGRQLSYRLWLAGRRAGRLGKRILPVRPGWYAGQIVRAREKVRKTSHQALLLPMAGGEARLRRYHSQMRLARLGLAILMFPHNCWRYAWLAASRLSLLVRRS